jgi:hypothetical protein
MIERPGPLPRQETTSPLPPTTPPESDQDTDSRAEWTREDDELLLLDEIEDHPDDDIGDLV